MFMCLANVLHGSETSHNAIIKPDISTFGEIYQITTKRLQRGKFEVQSQAARPAGQSGIRLDFRHNIIPRSNSLKFKAPESFETSSIQ